MGALSRRAEARRDSTILWRKTFKLINYSLWSIYSYSSVESIAASRVPLIFPSIHTYFLGTILSVRIHS